MRKVFLDELPKKEGVGHLKGKMVIDWNNSVGYRVSFVYDDIEGEIEIVGYDKENMELEIKYNDKVVKSRCQNFSYARIGQLVKDPYDNFRCEIGQIFKDSKRHLVIIDREHRKTTRSKGVVNEKWYKYKCNICTYEGWIREVKLIRNQGCSCCNGQTIDPKINSIYAKAPWMMKYLVNKEDGYKYAPQSNKNLMVKCPDCGKEKEMDIGKLYTRKSIGCTCGDGISYPEKFMSNILSQLELEFMTQLTKTTFKWCDKYKYDFYIPSLNMVIETHGNNIIEIILHLEKP